VVGNGGSGGVQGGWMVRRRKRGSNELTAHGDRAVACISLPPLRLTPLSQGVSLPVGGVKPV
jgi:hypothetical protein